MQWLVLAFRTEQSAARELCWPAGVYRYCMCTTMHTPSACVHHHARTVASLGAFICPSLALVLQHKVTLNSLRLETRQPAPYQGAMKKTIDEVRCCWIWLG